MNSIMSMVPIKYEEFTNFKEIMYEISKKILLEKIIYKSMCLYIISTELRLIE